MTFREPRGFAFEGPFTTGFPTPSGKPFASRNSALLGTFSPGHPLKMKNFCGHVDFEQSKFFLS